MHEPPHWRDRPQNERLLARECRTCGYVSFPEHRRICKRCQDEVEWDEVRLQERGTVRSYVVQNRLPDEFETPLPLAVLDMPQETDGEPARVYGLFTETEPDDIEIGMVADADLRQLFDINGLPVHSFKFKLPRGER
ncbi:Zn-ribbon domain-containing OB-fold protein [Natrinema halophilum]|uniref:Zn-ribbon domain-containing OB-fold protein n=1 Tax=Natrinema halophilum TaxID=1699371 RepID=UPI001F34AA57|nr:OB-fold domain-containing protein [Natrinema halophilum]UHQ96302.1 OB-fold domain-containing protein [Natrinema halophilum]